MNKRVISVLLSILLLISCIIPMNVSAASISLNKKKVTLEIDSTLKLKLTGVSATKVKWSSNNTKIAKVSKTGTITAISEGNATITASYKQKMYKCNVNVVDSSKNVLKPSDKALCADYYSIEIYEESSVLIMVKDKDITKATISFAESNDLITCYWDDNWYGNICPLWFSLNGIGKSSVVVSAEFSDGTTDTITIDVNITAAPTDENTSYNNTSNSGINSDKSSSNNDSSSDKSSSAYTYPLHLYSNDKKEYLGKLITNEYDSDSIFNSYGKYGSKYRTNSIWNEYGTYGSKYSSDSAFNKYTFTPPIIVDNNGNFFGYLTANESLANGYTITELRHYLINNNQ